MVTGVNDGDKSLVCADQTIIQAAERNCGDVVPLYYPMRKAAAAPITDDAKYAGMEAAWTGSGIGIVANQISKILNSGNVDLDAVKILCLENNFRIDYAKTLYMPTRPPEWNERLNNVTKGRVPRFFIYAKDKTPHQCEPSNNSTVNRLFDKIQSYKFNFSKKQLGTFDYKKLMHDPDIELGPKEHQLIRHYETMVRQIGDRSIGITDENDRYLEVVKTLRRELSEYGSDQYITDVLVEHLFGVKKSIHKAVLWDAYGSVIYQNLLDNKAGAQKLCSKCGARFTPLYPHHCLCDQCAKGMMKIPEDLAGEQEVAEPEKPIEAFCIDCGRTFTPSDLHQTRCPVCRWLAENSSVTAGPGEVVETCTLCGGAFVTRASGRGKRRKVCDRCRDEAKNARNRQWMKLDRRKKRLN